MKLYGPIVILLFLLTTTGCLNDCSKEQDKIRELEREISRLEWELADYKAKNESFMDWYDNTYLPLIEQINAMRDRRQSSSGQSGTQPYSSEPTKQEVCQFCRNTGSRQCTSCNGTGFGSACLSCNGSGTSRYSDRACFSCEGRGWNFCYSCSGTGNTRCYACY